MFGTFKAEIRIGNSEHHRVVDVAHDLEALAKRLLTNRGLREGVIRDINGNTVGSWSITEDPQ